MDGTASNEPSILLPAGDPWSFSWSLVSGPAAVTFDPADTTDVLDPYVIFTVPGDYVVMLQAFDSESEANDIVLIEVLAKELVGHWPLNNDALDYSVNSNDGTMVELEAGYPFYDTEAAIGSHSISLADLLPAVAPDPNFNEPNLPHIDLGPATELDFSINDWTVSAWIKTTQSGTGDANKGTIFSNGGDSGGGHRYCLILGESNPGRVMLVTDDNQNKDTTQTSGAHLVNDDLWHFIVGTRRGNEQFIYRDGILDDDDTLPDGFNLSGTSQLSSKIGAISDWNGSAGASTTYKQFKGLIDDVRVYNYGLDETAILALASMSELPATVYAGPGVTYVMALDTNKYTEGVVIDNGTPGTLNYQWTTVSGPDGANAIFDEPEGLTGDLSFPAYGTYVLRLTVEDVNLGMFISDDVTISVPLPLCSDVRDRDKLAGDISGPEGVLDCRVDLYDLAAFAEIFGRCNSPQDILCEIPAW